MNELEWNVFVEDFRGTLRRAASELRRLSEEDASLRTRPGAWSRKEIVGHLIDSASNNHQRFVRARFQRNLVFPGYDQDEWVRVEAWQHAPWSELVELWLLYNLQLARLMASTPAEERQRPRPQHNLGEIAFGDAPEPPTFEWFLRDYVAHLEHHLAQAGLHLALHR
ncbi:MAG: DinB family protein [Planctomycetes bacterium]|nr:DinB family protein [Planctomycetota bacterium]